ncbi:vomeronasal type-2 receptor, partial [Pristimantis euphronides]
MQDYTFEYKYSQDGDIIIGGIFTVHKWTRTWRCKGETFFRKICTVPSFKEYRHLLTFIFVIDAINRDPAILPNITLGYHLYDSCGDVNKVIKDVLQIMSGHTVTAPNYSCLNHGNVAGFIGDLQSLTTLPMARLLNVYGYTQISYGSRDFRFTDRRLYSHFFQTVQDNDEQYAVLVKLLIYFKWNMVCIFATDDEFGEQELRLLSSELTKSGICIKRIVFVNNLIDPAIIHNLKAEIVIVCGSSSVEAKVNIAHLGSNVRNTTFIFSIPWAHDIDLLVSSFNVPINCSFIISPLIARFNGLDEWFLSFHPSTHPNEPILEDFWITSLYCLSKNVFKNTLLQDTIPTPLHHCTGEEQFSNYSNYFEDGLPFNVYIAVQMVAEALDDMHKILQMTKVEKDDNKVNVYRKQLGHYMKLRCINITGIERKCFNNRGEIPEILMISNFVTKGNVHLQITETRTKPIGKMYKSFSQDLQLYIIPSDIVWINNKVPKSRCSEECLVGYRKSVMEGYYSCCYDCTLCPEGEISIVPDAENCQKCFYSEWPNEARNMCVPKINEYLSYETDVVAYVFLFFSVLSSIVILLIIGIFIYFWNTPVVRANNRNLSLIILISLKLSLLCTFLFIGKPVDTTCMFRHISFGIIFTVVLSSILAKTIMVCIAFKATTPGSYWRKWIGVRLPNCIVLVFSSLQILNGIVWLSCAPPFQELDMDSYPGKIIIQCNEGSRLALYFMMGYMGVLAAISLILAFMVRTLPDTYNEAKYITFSMLLFCSVWICAIPAYLSSKGKNMVSVEIFAIFASDTGILFCIFFPKLLNIV